MSYFSKQELVFLLKNSINIESDFQSANNVIKPFKRLGVYVDKDYTSNNDVEENFACNVPGCKTFFDNVKQYEIHYNSYHKHKCSVCKKVLPSNHLLEIHILEKHDTYFQLLAEKSPSLLCFLEECDLKFKTVDDRIKHCIEEHNFPRDFRFDVAHKTQKIKTKKVNEVNEDELTDSFKSLSFGHACSRAFETSNKLHKSKNKSIKMECESNKL